MIAKFLLGYSEIHCFPYADPTATVPLATAFCIQHPAACYFFLFSSCFEILHSQLAEIDIRPYEIDGNQPDFGYDWIDTIIWLMFRELNAKHGNERPEKLQDIRTIL